MSYVDEDLLESLAIPAKGLPPPKPAVDTREPAVDTREPTAEVVARAKEIVQEIKSGKVFSEQREDVPKLVRLRFLAHVLEGVPFLHEYKLFDEKLTLVFVGIPGNWETAVVKYAAAASAADRGTVYNRTLALLSLASLRRPVAGMEMKPLSEFNVTELPQILDILERKMSRVELLLVEQYFKRFRSMLNTMLDEANNPSFWNPLS